MSGRLIVFSGLDGAGKSTNITALEGELRSRGHRVRRVWSRGGYTPGFELLKALLRFVRMPVIPREPGRTARRQDMMRSGAVRQTWVLLANIDLAIFYGLWIRALRGFGWWVLADRYLHDTELDYQISFPADHVTNSRSWRLCRRVSPKPDIEFVFVVPVEESMRRSTLKREPFPDSADVLSERRDAYLRYAVGADCILIDGTREPQEVEQTVLAACLRNDAH